VGREISVASYTVLICKDPSDPLSVVWRASVWRGANASGPPSVTLASGSVQRPVHRAKIGLAEALRTIAEQLEAGL